MQLPGRDVVLLVTLLTDRRFELEGVSLSTKARVKIGDGIQNAIGVSSGHLLFIKEGQLLIARFDDERLAITGPSARVFDEIFQGAFRVSMSMSEAGTLILEGTERQRAQLMWVNRDGAEEVVDGTPRQFLRPRLSPDGSRIAFSTLDDGIWVHDTNRRSTERVGGTANTITEYPVWTPDGRGLFALIGDGIYRFDLAGNQRGPRLPTSVFGDFPSSISPDGRHLAVQRFTSASPDIYLLPLDGSPAMPLINSNAMEGGGLFSPDGRWMAYVSDESGQAQVYVRSTASRDHRVLASVNGGAQPAWRRDGRELFYREGDKMIAVQVSGDAEPQISRPTTLFDRRYAFGSTAGIAAYDVTADGKRFVMLKDQGGRAYVRVVLNAGELFKRLAPAPGS